MDITTLTETELKALCYEQVKLFQAAQNNIQSIENELQKRAAKPVTEGDKND